MGRRPTRFSNSKRSHASAAFTLIELMVVVCILGVLSAIAIPAFAGFVRRAKTSELQQNLGAMFKAAASYMAKEFPDPGLGGGTNNYCTVSSDALSPDPPDSRKKPYVGGANARAIGFSVADFVYYGYGFTSEGHCAWTAGSTTVYTFFAQGDLDGDGTRSSFELAAGLDDDRTLYHARSFTAVNEAD